MHRAVPEFSIPIADSKYTCRGWLFRGEWFYSYPDVAYPWDPAVLRAIREFEPTAMPIVIRSRWQRADYGNLSEPITLVRHGIARAVRDPIGPIHSFRCEMPVRHHKRDQLWTSPHLHAHQPPNYVEVNHYDRQVRPFGPDLPGAYLPFDWSFYHMLYESYENGRRHQDISRDYLDEIEAQDREFEKSKYDHVDRDAEAYMDKVAAEASDYEWKSALAGDPDPDHTPFVAVPAVTAPGGDPTPSHEGDAAL